MSYCTKCGKALEDGGLYCSFCGAPVSAVVRNPPVSAEEMVCPGCKWVYPANADLCEDCHVPLVPFSTYSRQRPARNIVSGVLLVVFAVIVIGGLAWVFARKSPEQKIVDAFSGIRIDSTAVDKAVKAADQLEDRMWEEYYRTQQIKKDLDSNSKTFQKEILDNWD